MTSVRIMLGQSETYVYSEVAEAELQRWLSSGIHADDLVTLLLARNGSLFYKDWQNSAVIFYRKDKTARLQFWHEGQEDASVQEFAVEV